LIQYVFSKEMLKLQSR